MKRRSRKELIQEIKGLKASVALAESKAYDETKKRKDIEGRFIELGNRIDLKQTDAIACVEVKPIAFGQYANVTNGLPLADLIDEVKSRLVTGIARGLIEMNYVQIIYNDDGPLGKTIGAKLFVVPWEQTVIGKGRKVLYNGR